MTWWFVLTRPEVDLCVKDPGFEVDLTVDADLAALTRCGWVAPHTRATATRHGSAPPGTSNPAPD
jgi:hypothetical protein